MNEDYKQGMRDAVKAIFDRKYVNPDHPLHLQPIQVRETGLLEVCCTHGVGHPVSESAQRLERKYHHKAGTWSAHGCDGCCMEVRPYFSPEWVEPALTEHVRKLGCKCQRPLLGYSPGFGPRCRLCGADAEPARGGCRVAEEKEWRSRTAFEEGIPAVATSR